MSENRILKARYWWAVLYPENMIEDWQSKIDDEVQVPFAYCVHSDDSDSKGDHRKDHVHLILAFPNTTTYKHALDIFKLLGEKAVNTCKACNSIRHCYDYLIHDTESCRKEGKHLYSADERVCGNGFDIGAYEQLSAEDKQAMLKELADFVLGEKVMNMADLTVAVGSVFDSEYFSILVKYNAFLERVCRGNYQKYGGAMKAGRPDAGE